MNDDEKEKDWVKLVEATHIEHATRNIKRLSLTIHLFLVVLFIRSLAEHSANEFLAALNSLQEDTIMKWMPLFDEFLEHNKKRNATFNLHCDIIKHCDEVLAIAAAERIGGPDGYALLLGAVKQSLPFAFLNGATSYGAFCVRLLIKHYSTGPFYQGLKQCLFSTPHKESETNIALDQQREMDHRDAMKGFRPRATVESVIPRMTQVDRMAEVSKMRQSFWGKVDKEENTEKDETSDPGLSWKVTEKDVNHVIPTLQMMLRANETILKDDLIPKNVYGADIRTLSDAILDEKTFEVGRYLIIKYVCKSGLLGHSENDIPVIQSHMGPTELMQKVTKGKGVVVRRATCKSLTVDDQRSAKERKRKKAVDKMAKVYDCLSSDMNACQAVLRPDCTKLPVTKSKGIKDALFWCLQECLSTSINPTTPTRDRRRKGEEAKQQKKQTTSYLAKNGIVVYSSKTIPQSTEERVKVAVVEFAGVKYKTFAMTGRQYLDFVETSVIHKVQTHYRSLRRMVICEEKYRFTPNDLKGPTRQKRKNTKEDTSIYHLKKGTEVVSRETFDKRAATMTASGKATVSLFLAENIPTLQLKNLLIDIDSEMLIEGCQCGTTSTKDIKCSCDIFTTPVRAEFGPNGFIKQHKLTHIKQKKGEAEMAICDWLRDSVSDLKNGEGVVGYVTSGDIDAVVIHLFALSLHWPRKPDCSFCFPVYIVLQKADQEHDIYCITRMIEIIEKKHGVFSGLQIAVGLAMGGNDFFPKFYGKSHKKMLQLFVENHYMWSMLDIVRNENGIPVSATVNENVFISFIKHVYCQSTCNPEKLTFEAVRQNTIKRPKQTGFRPPNQWLPPQSALLQLAMLLECQIEYLFTAWHPDMRVPEFGEKGCLKVSEDGFVEYDLGENVRIKDPEELLVMSDKELEDAMKYAKKKPMQQRAKRVTHETPQRNRKTRRQLITSTPRFV